MEDSQGWSVKGEKWTLRVDQKKVHGWIERDALNLWETGADVSDGAYECESVTEERVVLWFFDRLLLFKRWERDSKYNEEIVIYLWPRRLHVMGNFDRVVTDCNGGLYENTPEGRQNKENCNANIFKVLHC